MTERSVRLAVDTGGTFTDIVALDERTGECWTAKTPTTPDNTMRGVLDGVDLVGVDLEDVAHFFVLGSTTALNALIEGKGVRTAYVTTRGFRDVPEIARTSRPDSEIYNAKWARPPLLVDRPLRYEIDERILYSGEVHTALDEESVRSVAERIRESGVRSVAVCLLHAYSNPTHEERVRELLSAWCPGVSISLSSFVAREHREFERSMTTIVDAYIKPVVATWIDELGTALGERGFAAELLITRSDGGAMTAATGKGSPVQTLLSGPAGGVMGGLFLAGKLGMPNLVTMDVGGTSFDVCMIKDHRAELATSTRAEGYDLIIPNLDIRAVGAGGGSIAWIDAAGALHVGPRSAGANPGPLCYGQGGSEPTVTDALLCAGYIDPANFLGGALHLDVDLAHSGIERTIGAPLGMSVEEASAGILTIALNNMIEAIRSITVERGEDPRDYGLLCYGGGGPLFGALIMNELSMKSAVVPIAAANFSAWGMLTVDVRHAVSETAVKPLATVDGAYLKERFGALRSRAEQLLSAEGIPREDWSILPSIDLRYQGQEHTVNVAGPFVWDGDAREAILAGFNERYRAMFGYSLPVPAELVTLRIMATGRIPNPAINEVAATEGGPSGSGKRSRRVVDPSSRVSADYGVYDRVGLGAGDVVFGPALIEEPTTLTVVPPGVTCTVEPYGNLVLVRN